VELSLEALALAARRASERGTTLELCPGDMRDFVRPAAFDAAVCFYGSFGYFDDATNLAVARNVAHSLRAGGLFLIDTPVTESLFPRLRPRDWHWEGEGEERTGVLEERRWNPREGRLEFRWTLVSRARMETHQMSIRFYSCRELIELLRQAGFGHCRPLETISGARFGLGSTRLTLVATRL
jgi:SAM-dependent methyltransferase